MEIKTEKTVSEIIGNCGGVSVITKPCELTESAIAKWRKNGIPDRYWSRIIALSIEPLTVSDLFKANEALRENAA